MNLKSNMTGIRQQWGSKVMYPNKTIVDILYIERIIHVNWKY